VSADDLVQEVYLRLMKKDCRLLRQFDPGRATLRTWVALVARSVTIDHLRSHRRSAASGTEPCPEIAETVRSGNVEARDMIEYAKARLSSDEWTTLNLLMLEGLAPEAVGKRLGLSTKTVYNRKLRILKKLRQMVRGAAS
jgi:RNA polymerase sigma-70 factor (ECF subfamily)